MTDVPEIITIITHILFFLSIYFEVFLLITFFEWREMDRMRGNSELSDATPDNSELPSVTILVPCFNEESTVARTLHSLLSLDYPPEKLSIMAINDGSTDRTGDVLRHFGNSSRVLIIQKENGGKHTALNAALSFVTTDLVGCLDADSFVEHSALREIARVFEDPGIMAVTPAIKVHDSRTLVELIQKAEYAFSVFIRRTFSELDALFITPGPFSIFRTSAFKTLGPYKAAYNTEDLEIALRLQASGMRIGNAERAVVSTSVPNTFSSLFHQRLRWSYGFLKNIVDYRFLFFKPQYGNLGLFVLPLSVVSFFGALYFASVLIGLVIIRGIEKAVEIEAIGLVSFIPGPFDLFYVNTNSLIFLSIILLGLTTVLVVIGKTLLRQQRLLSFDLVCYFALYGLIAPLWIAKATYNVIVGARASWR